MTNKRQCYLLKLNRIKVKNIKTVLLFLFPEGLIYLIKINQSIFIFYAAVLLKQYLRRN